MVRQNAVMAGLFGSGGQAANQLLALLTERPGIKSVKIYSRDRENREAFAEKYGSKFEVDIKPVDSPREVIRDVDVIVCATNTNVELFDGDWLESGQHVTGIIGGNIQLVQGGFLKKARREIDNKTVARADVVVTNLRESVISEQQGDLYEPIQEGIIKIEEIFELGELATGICKGRTDDEQITYHKNNNGTAASELAVAMRAYELARKAGRGTMIDLIEPDELARLATK
jgi:ornithine cyclodeaminase/alanine dehydrogenase-like protein (mu-crystallin family)